MGITRKLVRTVFWRNRSAQTQESNERSRSTATGNQRRWSTVRLSDEFDTASVTHHHILQGSPDRSDYSIEKVKHNSTSSLFRREDAAIVIQLAFRNFLATRRSKEDQLKKDHLTESPASKLIMESKSPSRDSIGTSVEVQTGNSTGILPIRDDGAAIHHHMQKKARARIMKFMEDWDDSTVSSKISKMRVRNRQEATNRREKALAYAFSQQLRICSKKKQTKSMVPNQARVGAGWKGGWQPEFLNAQLKAIQAMSMSYQNAILRQGILSMWQWKRERAVDEMR